MQTYRLNFSRQGRIVRYGQYKQAETIYRQIAEDHPGTEHAFQAQKELAILYVRTNKDRQAQETLEQLVAGFSRHKGVAEAVYSIAKHFNWMNKHDKAAEIHRYNAQNFSPGKYAMWSQVEVIYHYIDAGDETAAQAASYQLLTAFSEQPTLPTELYHVAQKWQGAGDYPKAIQLYQYVIERWPKAKKALSAQAGLAISYELGGDKAAALTAHNKLLGQLRESDATAEEIYWIAKTFNWAKLAGRVAGIHLYNVERYHGDKHASWSQAEVIEYHVANGDGSAADAAARELITDFSGVPGLPRCVYGIARTYETAGRDDQARRLYQYVVDHRPTGEDIYDRMSASMAYIGLGDDAGAMAVANTLIADFRDHSDLAGVVFHIGEQYYERAKRARRKDRSAGGNEDFARAAGVWEKIITELPPIDPHTPQAYHFLAICYKQLGEYQKAIERYQRLVDNWRDSKYAYRAPYRIGLLYRDAEEYKQAVHWFKAQRRLYSDTLYQSRALLHQGAVLYFDLEDFEEAAQIYRQFISEQPTDQRACAAHRQLAKCYEKMDDKGRAIEVLEDMLNKFGAGKHGEIIRSELRKLREGE